MNEARAIIERLQLQAHPEGGWYRETWRAAPLDAGRSPGTAILFLLEPGQASHWHRVDASELWIFQAGCALELRLGSDDGVRTVRLGNHILAGDQPQQLVAPGQWQAALAGEGWCLVTCVVVPGFRFEGFELAAPGWAPGR